MSKRPLRTQSFKRSVHESPGLRAKAALPCLLSLLALGACSAGGPEFSAESSDTTFGATGQLEQPIVGGATDSTDNAVLAIATITPDSQALCSGTLIAPNLVLTARHCVVPIASELVTCGSSTFPAPYSPDELWVSPATSVRGANLFPVRQIIVPQDDGALCGADIALLILNGVFSTNVVPIAPRLDSPATSGEAFTAVGFGASTAANQAGAGTRRSVSDVQVVCGANQCASPDVLTDKEFVGEQGVCQGDSGGPALDATGRVLGVASRTGQNCEFAIYSAVSPWKDFIVSAAEEAQTLGKYAAPDWLTTALDAANNPPGDIAVNAGTANSGNGDISGTANGVGAVVTPGNGSVGDVVSNPASPVANMGTGQTTMSSSNGGSGCSFAGPVRTSTSPLWLGALGLGLVGRLRRRRLH